MENSILCTFDFLYDSGEAANPGSIHINVLHPNKRAKLPIVIEERSKHNPLSNLHNIIDIISSELFSRVNIDVKKDVVIYLKNSEKTMGDYRTPYIKVYYETDELLLKGVEIIE